MSESRRAEIDPLIGLKMSCPSREPNSFSSFDVSRAFWAPTGSPNVSVVNTNVPAVPGVGIDAERLGVLVAWSSRSPCPSRP